MADKKYPNIPWKTINDPIAGHPREYKNGYNIDWYTNESPKGTYRSIFKWGNQKEYKVPSEGMFNYLEKALKFDKNFLESHKAFSDSKIDFEDKCKLTKEEIASLLKFVDGKGSSDKFDRLDIAYGQTMVDLIRLREGICENVPDLVLYPSTTEEIEKIVAYCNEKKIAIYVYGGGSSVTRGAEATVERNVMLHLGVNFNKIIEFNEKDLTLRVQPGLSGVNLEAYLNNPNNFPTKEAYTFGHFPQSFEYSTVGGWVVTRGAGQNSAYYGKIEDLVLYQQYVTPVGKFTTEKTPRKATGPDIDQIMMGNEGAYGILTEVCLKLHKLSDEHKKFFYFFKSWEEGVDCMREVMQAEGGKPSVFRISDAEETELGMYMYGLADKSWFKAYIKSKGLELGKMTFMVGFTDGSSDYQKATMKTVRKVAKLHGAISLPFRNITDKAIVDMWSRGRFSDPYLRDNFQDYGVIIDTLECAVNWDNLHSVHQYVRKFVKSHPETVCTSHISHPYEQGANLYFIWMQKALSLDDFKEFHSGVLNAISKSGASVSHHHGIGKLFAKYNAESLGPVQMDILKALKKHFDPNGIMNPGGTLWLDK
ncbi:MAG: FAD-binding oxidoreductase [Clostridia bacterium]